MFAVNLTVVIMVSTSWNKVSQSIDHSHDGFHLQCRLSQNRTFVLSIPFDLFNLIFCLFSCLMG